MVHIFTEHLKKILVKMEKEERFYSIDAAIELVENPKYDTITTTTRVDDLLRDLNKRKGQGQIKVKRSSIIRELAPYKRFQTIETSSEEKQIRRDQAIENLKAITSGLMTSRIPLESNLVKLDKHIKTLNRLQANGIIPAEDESVKLIKDQSVEYLSENPKGELEKEIDEILGDPIKEIEIPIEDVPVLEGPKGSKPGKPGEEKEK